jgi:hypothetical protein
LIGSYYYTRTTNGGTPFNKCFRLVSVSPTPVGTLLTYVGPETPGSSISYTDCASCTGVHPCVDPSPTPTPTVTPTITPTATKTPTPTPTVTPTTSPFVYFQIQECGGVNFYQVRDISGISYPVGNTLYYMVINLNDGGSVSGYYKVVTNQNLGPKGVIQSAVADIRTCSQYSATVQLCCSPFTKFSITFGESGTNPFSVGDITYLTTTCFTSCVTVIPMKLLKISVVIYHIQVFTMFVMTLLKIWDVFRHILVRFHQHQQGL